MTNVQRFKGKVSIQSRAGKGTTVRLELPLTIATSKVLLVTGSHSLYGLPLEAIRETVKVFRGSIRTLKGREIFLWRGRPLPLLRLSEVLGANGPPDDVVGEQEIILKPLTGELAMVRIYLGAAILGDGSVLLVLDPANLVREGAYGCRSK
jgi:two-component system chemotaxis sensor kinase CheA